MKKVLILCTGNSCRSQMAEGYLRHFAGGRALIMSAGIETHGVNPKAIAVMKEDGVDISSHTSNNIEEYLSINFDYVITVCDSAKEKCPIIPGDGIKFHHSFPDPAKAQGNDLDVMEMFRLTRNLIKDYCRNFASTYLAA